MNFRQGGGSNYPKSSAKQAKKKKKKREEERNRRVGVVLSLLQKYDLNRLSRQIIYIQVYFWSFVQLQAPLYTNTHMARYFWYCKCVEEGGAGGPPPGTQKTLGSNGVISCNSRQERYENALL